MSNNPEQIDSIKLRKLKEDGIDKFTETVYKMGHEDGREDAEKDLQHRYSRPWHWAPLAFMIGMAVGMVGLAALATALFSLASSIA